jgi:hypothetical protein
VSKQIPCEGKLARQSQSRALRCRPARGLRSRTRRCPTRNGRRCSTCSPRPTETAGRGGTGGKRQGKSAAGTASFVAGFMVARTLSDSSCLRQCALRPAPNGASRQTGSSGAAGWRLRGAVVFRSRVVCAAPAHRVRVQRAGVSRARRCGDATLTRTVQHREPDWPDLAGASTEAATRAAMSTACSAWSRPVASTGSSRSTRTIRFTPSSPPLASSTATHRPVRSATAAEWLRFEPRLLANAHRREPLIHPRPARRARRPDAAGPRP